MFKALRLLVCVLMVFSTSLVFASPIHLPQGIKSEEGLGWMVEGWPEELTLSVAGLYENVSERKLKDYDAEAKADIAGGELSLSILNTADIYVFLGSAMNPEYKAQLSGSDVRFELDDSFLWGVGFASTLYEMKDEGIKLFCDANFRTVRDMDYNAVIVDGVYYTKGQLTGTKVSANWKEWQLALGISKKFEYLTPYIGFKYSDIKASAKATAGGTTYDAGEQKSDMKFGPFVGVSITPNEWISIDLDGRFVDETAFSAAVKIKF